MNTASLENGWVDNGSQDQHHPGYYNRMLHIGDPSHGAPLPIDQQGTLTYQSMFPNGSLKPNYHSPPSNSTTSMVTPPLPPSNLCTMMVTPPLPPRTSTNCLRLCKPPSSLGVHKKSQHVNSSLSQACGRKRPQFKSQPLPLTSLIPHPNLEHHQPFYSPCLFSILAILVVTPKETGWLVKYWIDQLTQEKADYVSSLEPTPYNLLPYEAKVSIALRRIEEQRALQLKYRISFNNLVRTHAETRRQRYLKRTTPFLTSANSGSINATSIPSANPSRLVPNYSIQDNTPSTHGDPDANKDFLDYDLDNPSSQVSSQHPHVPVNGTASLTNDNAAQVQAATNTTSGLAARVKAMTLPQIQRVDPLKETASAMDIDKLPPSLGATPSCPKPLKEDNLVIITHKEPLSDEISLLSKEDQIRVLVKNHVAIHAQFLQAQKDDKETDLKALLFKAQENQKSLQKLIPNPEIKLYVKGWNPWVAKRTLFPPQTKRKREGKSKSLAYKRMKYGNQDTWAKVADIALAVRSLYKATKSG
ncbi:hypothetical protein PCANC_17370 [Puccinia coronata f. sp. avenae]|uniref:Uncharacterized protein n=1 Tax=Puccinia coronata f. sp. avenae TaxID=200324 RepID=A0A2N5UZW4_9BASI|nr:hypothetical protein PCANC_17370 [Puccinia coronata f. sp. avenae]